MEVYWWLYDTSVSTRVPSSSLGAAKVSILVCTVGNFDILLLPPQFHLIYQYTISISQHLRKILAGYHR